MEDITDADYKFAKINCQDFRIEKLIEYLDLYVPSNILLLIDVSMIFRNMFQKIPGLA